MDLEDRDFSFWLTFFKQKGSLEIFKEEIEKKDAYFLNHPLELDFEDENYADVLPGGFLEEDFQKILDTEIEDKSYYTTRLAIAIGHGIKFNLIKDRISQKSYYDVLEYVLINGEYENFNLEYEYLLIKSIKNLSLPQESIFDISFLRGVEMGKRYPD